MNATIAGASLTLLHSERPKLYGVLAVLSVIGLNCKEGLRNPTLPLADRHCFEFLASIHTDKYW